MATVLGLLPGKVLSAATGLQVWESGLLKKESSTNLSIHKLSSYSFAQLRSSVQAEIRLCDQTFLVAPLMSLSSIPPSTQGSQNKVSRAPSPAGPFRDACSQPHQPTLPAELCWHGLVFAPAAARQKVLGHCLLTPAHQPAHLPGWDKSQLVLWKKQSAQQYSLIQLVRADPGAMLCFNPTPSHILCSIPPVVNFSLVCAPHHS